jgi:hypothetical protein
MASYLDLHGAEICQMWFDRTLRALGLGSRLDRTA